MYVFQEGCKVKEKCILLQYSIFHWMLIQKIHPFLELHECWLKERDVTVTLSFTKLMCMHAWINDIMQMNIIIASGVIYNVMHIYIAAGQAGNTSFHSATEASN